MLLGRFGDSFVERGSYINMLSNRNRVHGRTPSASSCPCACRKRKVDVSQRSVSAERRSPSCPKGILDSEGSSCLLPHTGISMGIQKRGLHVASSYPHSACNCWPIHRLCNPSMLTRQRLLCIPHPCSRFRRYGCSGSRLGACIATTTAECYGMLRSCACSAGAVEPHRAGEGAEQRRRRRRRSPRLQVGCKFARQARDLFPAEAPEAVPAKVPDHLRPAGVL